MVKHACGILHIQLILLLVSKCTYMDRSMECW